MTVTLDHHRFAGDHGEIGEQYGAACRALIHEHVRLALGRLADAGIDRERALATAEEYRPWIVEHAPFLDDEIRGLARGAGIAEAEAYLLQLRAEVLADLAGEPSVEAECTTFAVAGGYTADGRPLGAQNADLPEFYERLMVVVEFAPTAAPHVLMVVPAGQVSYIGVNDAGLAVFGNFLACRGWRRGFPRYLLSRFALQYDNAEDALAAVRRLPRASSRNLLMLDASGTALDFENTPQHDAVLRAEDGILTHANHYLDEELARLEHAHPRYLLNSRIRLARIRTLLDEVRGALDPHTAARVLRDRADAPDALSVHPEDLPDGEVPPEGHYVTVTSLIASPSEGRIWVSAGAPSRAPYVEYSFAAGRIPGLALEPTNEAEVVA